MGVRFRSPSIVALASLLLAVVAVAAENDPAGRWQGAISLPGSALALDVDLARADSGGWRGDISIPAQGAADLPLEAITIEADQIAFTIRGIPGAPRFAGTMSADGASMAGTFTQGGQSFAFALARAQAPAEAVRGRLDGFDEFVERAREAWKVPGLGVAIVKDGEVVLARGYGMRDTGAKLPATERTLFAIGSATKAFTTFVMGTLVDEGRMEWDDAVRSYIPWFTLKDETVGLHLTPRDLVTHRSGLPRHDLLWYNNVGATRRELVEKLAFVPANADLRAKFQYNNMMYLTAGVLIETVTARSWEEAVRERVLAPLGMRRSNFSVLDSQHDNDHALPYRLKEDKLERIPFRVITNMGPAGSINSSAEEMARWLLVHTSAGKLGDTQVISAATLTDLHTPQMTIGSRAERPDISPADYALGWFVDTYRGHRRVHHGGAIDGFLAQVIVFPQDRLGIVVLANLGGSPLPDLVGRHAADRLLGLEPVDWSGDALKRWELGKAAKVEAKQKKHAVRKPGTKPAHQLAEYAGDYVHPGYGTVRVTLEGGRLQVSYNGLAAALEHWHYDVFNAVPPAGGDDSLEDRKLTFHTDARGNVSAVAIALEPAVDEIILARRPDAWMSDPAQLARLAGTYEVAGQALTVALKGSSLSLTQAGGRPLDLLPDLGGVFGVKNVSVLSIRFVTAADGTLTGMELQQPDGVYLAAKK